MNYSWAESWNCNHIKYVIAISLDLMLFEYSRRTISVSKVISGAVTKKKNIIHT